MKSFIEWFMESFHHSEQVALFTLEKIQPRVISFEEQVSSLRQHLAQMYERQELWKQVSDSGQSFQNSIAG